MESLTKVFSGRDVSAQGVLILLAVGLFLGAYGVQIVQDADGWWIRTGVAAVVAAVGFLVSAGAGLMKRVSSTRNL